MVIIPFYTSHKGEPLGTSSAYQSLCACCRRGRLGRVHARHLADHASLPNLIERLNVSEAQIKEVMQALKQEGVNSVASDLTNKGGRQVEIARAILMGQPHDRKHYRTATVSALRNRGATLPDEFCFAGLAASLV